jgi:hypothetical protein
MKVLRESLVATVVVVLVGVYGGRANGEGDGEECTTAVIGTGATLDGRPIVWKNRDTDQLSNKVLFVRAVPHNYLAVTNAEDTSGRIAWGGLNAAGFAVINSVAYNLPERSGESADLEGILMAEALRTCSSIGEFESFIRKNLGPGLGARTNFCVIDAQGGSAIFEVYNHGYRRYDVAEAQERYLLNTNFSRSGTADQGAGYLRFDRETTLFSAVPQGKLTHGFVLQNACRDLGHALLLYPSPDQWKTLPAGTPYWVHANYTINRGSTACAIVIHGVRKGEDPAKATLWVILGEPVCSVAIPLWVAAGDPPAVLREGSDAPLYTEATRLKNLLRPLKGRDRKEYVDVTRLDNKEGTGWLPGNLALERQILMDAERLLASDPTPAAMAVLEQEAAGRVMKRLQKVR